MILLIYTYMKNIHDKLAKEILWYRDWHKDEHSEHIHYLIVVFIALVNLYLGITLLTVISS